MTMPPHTPLVLITGASGGIGEALARRVAADGCSLVLVARQRDALSRLAEELSATHGIRAHVMPADLTDPAAPQTIMEELQRQGLTVDVLVNNAGVGLYGPFAQTDWEAQRRMMQLNMTALTHLTKLCLPHMIAQRSGKILNVASTAAFQPGPLMAVYYATKAYVLSFSEALANELQGSGVTVTALCPGPTLTQFQSQANLGAVRLLRIGLLTDAAAVARAGYAGLMKGRTVVIPGTANRLLVGAVRVLPRRWVIGLTRWLQERA